MEKLSSEILFNYSGGNIFTFNSIINNLITGIKQIVNLFKKYGRIA